MFMDIRGSQPLQETLNLLPDANRSTDTERKHFFFLGVWFGGSGLPPLPLQLAQLLFFVVVFFVRFGSFGKEG